MLQTAISLSKQRLGFHGLKVTDDIVKVMTLTHRSILAQSKVRAVMNTGCSDERWMPYT